MNKGADISIFEILNKYGEGGFGSVYKVKRKDDGKFYAMKKIMMLKLSNKEKENALNEIRILASIQALTLSATKMLFIVMPLPSCV